MAELLAPFLDLRFPEDDDGVADALADGAEVLVSFDWRPDFLSSSLRWVQGRGIGFDRFPVHEFARRGVIMTTASGVHHGTVAEHAVALLLAVVRGIPHSVRAQAEHQWSVREDASLAGSTIAVLGVGDIGTAVAARLRGWEVHTIGITRDPQAHPEARQTFDELCDLNEFDQTCHRADALVVCIPRPVDGRPVVTRRHLHLLGEGLLIDVSRGGVVDATALESALRKPSGLSGAGLDVFPIEPLAPDAALWDLPNVLITPHKAGASKGNAGRFARLVRTNAEAYAGEGPWFNRVIDGAVTNRLRAFAFAQQQESA